ncbi:MAG: hydroxysqualene dehydroxylase HpnE [Acidiferrobacterales bacterium]
MKVVIVGGGWAGLAAAVQLIKNNISVSLLEASRQLGGRARLIRFGKNRLDNGQHIMLGAYKSLLQLMKDINIKEDQVLKRLPLDLKLLDKNKTCFHLRTGNLPAPVHLLTGLIFARGLSLKDRATVFRAIMTMRLSGFNVAPDIPLQEYLHHLGQTKKAVQYLWQPLCISILNTPIETASTEIFLKVIRDAFFGKKSDSEMLLPINNLGACFPDPAMDYIEQNNGNIQLGFRVDSLNISNNTIKGVISNNEILAADNVILASAPEHTLKLISGIKVLNPVTTMLEKIESLPITTLYLRYGEPVSLNRDFVGFANCHTQWVFDRGRLTGDTGILAAVISGPGKHMTMTTEELTSVITKEITDHYPMFPAPIETKLVREKRATIAASVGINKHRIKNESPVKGLWFAGDYTDTGYPSTLEGAVRSGLNCAQLIINE